MASPSLSTARVASGLLQALTQLLGADHVLQEEAARRAAGADIFPSPHGVLPDLVLCPGSTEEVAAAMRLLAQAGHAVVPRGGGMSYTGGVVPTLPSVALDLRRLNQARIEAQDLYAVVGAGVTWEALREALRPHGLRAAQQGPISGSVSTVGGAASQGMPGGMDGVIGLTAVLADGSVLRTGSAAQPGLPPFARYHGPDLTGLFLGDCGAFGVKAEVVLRLVRERPAAFASLGFATARETLDAILCLIAQGFTGRAFAMDRAKAEAAGKVEGGEALRTALAVAGEAGSIGQALRRVAGLARTRGELASAGWTLHLTVDGATEAVAQALLAEARQACGPRAEEMTPSVPMALHAKPFSVRGIVGTEGERWVPVHGILAPSRAMACLLDLEAHVAAQADRLNAAGISLNWLMSCIGPQVTIEPMMYWPDALEDAQLRVLSPRNQARFGGRQPNPTARALVREMREALRAIFQRHGATHAQLGRFYAPLPADGLAARIKRLLDPERRMNPGVLGL